ncbi:MAG: hypothetical protein ACTS8W_02505, partial [Arsenophonus sp. NC-PY1-MAG3]
MAKHLEPPIPEECLVAKMAYHFDDTVPRARLTGQVKTIAGMEELLGDYEREEYYRKGRKNRDLGKYRDHDNHNNHNNNNNNDNNRVNYINTTENTSTSDPRINRDFNHFNRQGFQNNSGSGEYRRYNNNHGNYS